MKRMTMIMIALAAAWRLSGGSIYSPECDGGPLDEATVDGYTWTYRVVDDMAEIFNDHFTAISPKPTGALTIPSTLGGYPVTSIASGAFKNCEGLTSVAIPSCVRNIKSAFGGCSGLVSISVAAENADYSSANGLLLSKDGKKLIKGVNGDVTIPNGVISIEEDAFWGCSGLTSVTIPSSVRSIGVGAFGDCDGLTRVTIPSGVASIGEEAFAYCSGLTRVTIPDSVTSIEDCAFDECNDSLFDTTTIPGVRLVDGWAVGYTEALSGDLDLSGVRGVGEYAFYDCGELKNVTIPGNVTHIGEYAFGGCSGLVSITVAAGNSSYSSANGLLLSKDGKTLIQGVNGDVTIPDGVTSIGDYAFEECKGLTRVTIPSSVTSIGEGAFYACTGLKDVTIGEGVTSIGANAFEECKGLTRVTIPSSVTSIGVCAFSGCEGLTSVTILGSVTDIGQGAFQGCEGLADERGFVIVGGVLFAYYGEDSDVTIPNDITRIEFRAFDGCEGLTRVTIPDSVMSIGRHAFDGCNDSLFDTTTIPGVILVDGWAVGTTESLSGELDLTGIRGIAGGAFFGCENLTSVTMSDSVRGIGVDAFCECRGLQDVTIGAGVTSIGDEAFYACQSLTSVTIPGRVASIGGGVFGGCSKLQTFSVAADNPSFFVKNGLLCDKEGTMVIACPGALTEVTIPEGVTSFGMGAFDGTRLMSVTVPDGVTTLPDFAFASCEELRAVELPAGLVRLEDEVFEDCSSLTNITFKGNAPSVGEDVFYGVDSSCTVYVPRGSTGWGVTIPGVWNGMWVEYVGGEVPPAPVSTPGTITVTSEATAAGRVMRLVFHRTGGSDGRIAVKVKTQTSTGICGTDFDYVKEVLVWEDGDASDKVIEIPTYGSGAGKQLRVKLATLTTGAYAGCVTPKLAESKVYADMTEPNPGTITVTAPDPLSVVAGDVLRMTFSRMGGSDGKIAVKAKTQTSTALMGTNGSADFDYVKKTFEWADGDTTDRYLDIPTYVQPWEGVRMLRVKLATLATGTYAGNLTPALAESKIYAEIESPVAFGTVTVAPDVAEPAAGQPLRLVFRRVGGNDYPIAVKYKVQTSTAVAGTDFEYKKGIVTWADGESGEQVVEVPTYPSAAGKQLRVKLSTLTQGVYEGCVTPHLNAAKVYVPLR